jgi:hypothetical protein
MGFRWFSVAITWETARLSRSILRLGLWVFSRMKEAPFQERTIFAREAMEEVTLKSILDPSARYAKNGDQRTAAEDLLQVLIKNLE